MKYNWLQRLIAAGSNWCRRPAPRLRPVLESLEDRLVPTGELDGTFGPFGSGGRVVTEYLRPVASEPRAMIAYSIDFTAQDQSVYEVAGQVGGNLSVTRFKDGVLDTTYGDSGSAIVDFGVGSTISKGEALTRQVVTDGAGHLLSSGTIVVGSMAGAVAQQLLLVRFNDAGKMDPLFHNEPRTLPGITVAFPHAVVCQPDGKILVVGQAIANIEQSDADFFVARFDAVGALDPTFGTNGVVTTSLSEGGLLESANGVLLQADGKIVVAGTAGLDPIKPALVRYNSNGTLDTTFGGTGHAFAFDVGHGNAVAVGPHGEYYLAGDNEDSFVISEFSALGVTGNRHFAHFSIPAGNTTFDSARWIGLRTNATDVTSILVAGDSLVVTDSGSWRQFSAAAFPPILVAPNPDGLFTTSIKQQNTVSGLSAALDAVTGGIVMVRAEGPRTDSDLGLVRLTPDLDPDPSFGTGGKLLTRLTAPASNRAQDMVTADGSIIVVGNAGDDFGVFRYSADGTLNTSFGDQGKVATDFNHGFEAASAVAVQPDGRIVVAGNRSPLRAFTPDTSNKAVALARYNPNGTLDTTFGSDGLVTFDPTTTDDFAVAVSVLANGQILVAGTSAKQFLLARFSSTGELLDSKTATFHGTGDFAQELIVQPDGKLVIVGTAGKADGSGTSDFGLMRFNPDFTLDTTFDADGMVTTDVSSFGSGLAFGAALDSAGRIVVAGGVPVGKSFLVARYLTNGSIDTTFGNSGIASISFGTNFELAFDVVVRPNGNIVVGGAVDLESAGGGRFGIVELRSDGSLNPSFGTGGKTSFHVGPEGFSEQLFALALQPNGYIIAAGESATTLGGDGDFALARVTGSNAPVTPPNTPPTLAALSDQTVIVGTLLSFTVSGSDQDVPAQALTYSASNLPAGATFDAATRTFRWTPTSDQVGTSMVTFTVSDGKLTDSKTIGIVVSAAPTAGVVQFSADHVDIKEDQAAVVLTIQRVGGTAGSIDVQYTITVPTSLNLKQQSTPGQDFTGSLTGTITFAAGETQKTLSITLINDKLVENTESFVVTLSTPTGGAALGNPGSSRVNLIDDDLPVVPDAQPERDLLQALANIFGKSEEHYRDFVRKAYERFLGRLPDEQGFTYWVTLMQLYEESKHQQGLRQEQIEAGFLASPEYLGRYGGLGQALIEGIYHDLLGRAGDQTGIDYWMTQLAAGVSASTIALGFTASQERLRNRVAETYRRLLDREADEVGLAYWISVFNQGGTTEDIISGFVGSPEYYYTKRGAGNPAQWTREAYLDVLFRPATVAEFDYWLSLLRGQ